MTTRRSPARRWAATGSRHSPPSFWLEQLGSQEPRPALEGEREADVCIVGGGFTGLWTAYELARAQADLKVVVLEAEHVGFGASGRNGGWVLGEVSGSPAAWRRRAGPGAAGAMARAIHATVAEIGAVIEREAITCDWTRGGSLTVAQTEPQLKRLRAELALNRECEGADCMTLLLDAAEVAERVIVRGSVGALFTPHCARIQPAKLAVGLAAAVERAGAVIYENSRVVGLQSGLVQTVNGSVRARCVVLATEGYTANLPGRRRSLLPLNSAMIVTEPLGEQLWRELRWSQAETLLDGSHLYTYSQRTGDGRIAIGGRGVPYRFGSRTDREGPVPGRTVQELHERLVSLFPALADVGIERAWHGVLGVARDWCPRVGFDARSGLGFAGGYAGEGVAASNLAARTLRDLVLNRESDLTRLPWVGPPPRSWEPEPLRFIGARSVYGLYRCADRREAAIGRESRLAAVADRLAGR